MYAALQTVPWSQRMTATTINYMMMGCCSLVLCHVADVENLGAALLDDDGCGAPLEDRYDATDMRYYTVPLCSSDTWRCVLCRAAAHILYYTTQCHISVRLVEPNCVGSAPVKIRIMCRAVLWVPVLPMSMLLLAIMSCRCKLWCVIALHC
jgi:hypothetical protein